LALGEEGEALARFAAARNLLSYVPLNESRELRYRINYNEGVAFFSTGDFSNAQNSFIEALRIDGRRIEAKRNLELSILSHERQNNSSAENESSQERSSRSNAVLDYIREMEVARWVQNEWGPEEYSDGPDY
jgi:Ca-activated chloride channel family protein